MTGGAATSTRPLAEPEPVPAPVAATPEPVDPIPVKATRRWIIGGALAATGAVAFGVWTAFRPRPDPRYLELLDRGKQALRMGLPDSNQQGVEIFQEAVAIRPDDAAAWGLLALAKSHVADRSPSRSAGSNFQDSEQAARRALALDEREPNALVVLAMLQRNLDDWLTTERKLRAVLAIAPDNAAALDGLVALLQASGYLQESWDLNERAVALDPLRPGPQFRKALKHWIMGRSLEADQVIARARELWPAHPLVWNARLLISAFTGQIQAARILIKDQATTSLMITPTGVATWDVSLTALETRDPRDIAEARAANVAAAPLSPGLSVHAIMIMGALEEVDTAYSIINGSLATRRAGNAGGLGTRPEPRQRSTLAADAVAVHASDQVAASDPRFRHLQDIGLAEFWRGRGVPRMKACLAARVGPRHRTRTCSDRPRCQKWASRAPSGKTCRRHSGQSRTPTTALLVTGARIQDGCPGDAQRWGIGVVAEIVGIVTKLGGQASPVGWPPVDCSRTGPGR